MPWHVAGDHWPGSVVHKTFVRIPTITVMIRRALVLILPLLALSLLLTSEASPSQLISDRIDLLGSFWILLQRKSVSGNTSCNAEVIPCSVSFKATLRTPARKALQDVLSKSARSDLKIGSIPKLWRNWEMQSVLWVWQGGASLADKVVATSVPVNGHTDCGTGDEAVIGAGAPSHITRESAHAPLVETLVLVILCRCGGWRSCFCAQRRWCLASSKVIVSRCWGQTGPDAADVFVSSVTADGLRQCITDTRSHGWKSLAGWNSVPRNPRHIQAYTEPEAKIVEWLKPPRFFTSSSYVHMLRDSILRGSYEKRMPALYEKGFSFSRWNALGCQEGELLLDRIEALCAQVQAWHVQLWCNSASRVDLW